MLMLLGKKISNVSNTYICYLYNQYIGTLTLIILYSEEMLTTQNKLTKLMENGLLYK